MLALTGSAASDRSLLTAAEVQAALGAEGTSATAQQIADLRARVSAAICRACKVPGADVSPPTLRLEALTETIELGRAVEDIELARKPLVSIVSITEDDETLTASDYRRINDSKAVLQRRSSGSKSLWASGCDIVVVYTAGWATVPDDLKLAAVKMAALLWSEGRRVDPNLKSEVIPGVRDVEYWVSPSDDPLIPREVMELLAPYINHVVG